MTRGERGSDGSTCDSSGGRGSWWLSGAASVEEGWDGEREERGFRVAVRLSRGTVCVAVVVLGPVV